MMFPPLVYFLNVNPALQTTLHNVAFETSMSWFFFNHNLSSLNVTVSLNSNILHISLLIRSLSKPSTTFFHPNGLDCPEHTVPQS